MNTILAERPYPQVPPTEWLRIPAVLVPIEDVVFTQEVLQIRSMLERTPVVTDGMSCEPPKWDEAAHLVRWQGQLYVENGHHRLVRLMVMGATLARCRVLELGGS